MNRYILEVGDIYWYFILGYSNNKGYLLRYIVLKKQSEKLEKQIVESYQSLIFSEKGIPSGWRQLNTLDFIIKTNANIEFVETATRKMKNTFLFYKELYPCSAKLGKINIKIFRKNAEFQAYSSLFGFISPVAATYHHLVEVAFNGELIKDDVIYHEMWHPYLYYYLGVWQESEGELKFDKDIKVPFWFNEGMAEYFRTLEYKGKEFSYGNPLKENLDRIKNAIKDNKYVQLTDFLNDSAEYNDYAQAWSICYFLMKSSKYKRIIKDYIEKLRESGDFQKAFAKTFNDINIKNLEEEWRAFYLEEK
jgi:hypothetical protein